MNKNYYGKLLSPPTVNYKAKKNINLDVHTYFLSLAPSDISGHNVCPVANRVSIQEKNPKKSDCSYNCVAYNGNGNYPSVIKSRIRKTKMFFEDRETFLKLLYTDIKKAVEYSEYYGFKATFRLNAYSDIKWENVIIKDNKNIFQLFPNITFYDYHKVPIRKPNKNYELTYSHWGDWEETNRQIENGSNIAMVFDKKNPLPKKYKGMKVIDGDKTDLRTKENDGNGVIVGLIAKMSKKAISEELKKEKQFVISV